jgi:pSer/pThr/pTyr-binding forkhead associated (FHA) protein
MTNYTHILDLAKEAEPPVPPPLPPPPPESEPPKEPTPESPNEEVKEVEESPTTKYSKEDEPPAPPKETPSPSATKNVVLQVYHDLDSRVVHTHRVLNNITLIGREDPQRDIFPDLDLGKLASAGVSASCASRQHLRLIRQGNDFFLFIYKGTTGTQVNKDIIDESRYGRRFPIAIGDRIILGGKIRLKLSLGE